MRLSKPALAALSALAILQPAPAALRAQPAADLFQPRDVFELEWASDPQISPDGDRIAFVRNFMDIQTDERRSEIWAIDWEGLDPRPIVTGDGSYSSPRWSPDGDRLLYVASRQGSAQLFLRWMDGGESAQLTRLSERPGDVAWSPDGLRIAFSMRVPKKTEPMAEMPSPPPGAVWADPPRVIEKMIYRADGAGYLEEGYTHLFLLPATGGTPRQLTRGDFDHGATPCWTPDGRALIFSANRRPDWEHEPRDSEIYRLEIETGEIRALTDRRGPDSGPAVAPDGRIAYLGFDDRYHGYQLTRLYLMDSDGSGARRLAPDLDRDAQEPVWTADGRAVLFRYDDEGNGKIARVDMEGRVQIVAADVGGLSLGRPYSSGQFTAGRGGRFAYTMTRPDHPADIARGDAGGGPTRRLTRLNEDLLGPKSLAQVDEIRFESSHDGRPIQGWIAKPPGFDPQRSYPLILEIHGGPFANYGDRFAAEIQLYAAAGYIVLYLNPRGSTSYGEEFGNLIHHNYPGEDYDDLISGVEAVVARGWADPERLFVTGGSGGGVLTAWIVGKTDRFRAAVSAKPVINWYSFVLTADAYNFFYKYWFPALPWDDPGAYLKRSPLSLAGNVRTPTMLLTGEEDYRTPISESEQFYQALKLRRVETALVRIPGASHGIARRPSQLIAKVAHVLAWFARHDRPGEN